MNDLKGVKKSLVFLNTKDSCFFCLKQGHEDNENYSFSLKNLCSYLKISLNGENEVSKEFKKLLKETEDCLEVEVSTCSSCKVLGGRLSKLFLELERIKLEVDSCLDSLVSEMPMGGEAAGVQSFYQRMESDEGAKAQLQVVDSLRKEISEKCLARLPHVKLARIHKTVEETVPIEENCGPPSIPDIKHEIEDFEGGSPDLKSPKEEDNDDLDCKTFLAVLLESPPPPISEPSDEAEQEINFGEGSEEMMEDPLESKEEVNLKKETSAKRFQCSKCDKSFDFLCYLKKHFNAAHLRNKYECNICHVAMFGKDKPIKLAAHKKKCEERLQKRLENEKKRKQFGFACKICGKKFDSNSALNKHRVRVHENVDRYPCDLCEKKFKKPDHVKRHKDAVHFGKKFSCKFCKKEYKRDYLVRNHEKKCTEKPRIKIEPKIELSSL